MENNTLTKSIVGILSVAAIAGFAYYTANSKAIAPQEVAQNTTIPPITNATSTTPSASLYKDGTYSSSGTYRTPEGQETIDISVTISHDTVTNATFTGYGREKASRINQDAFAAGFKEQVVGKPVDAISLTVVNGSSLTSKGFMDALAKIKLEAKA